MTWRHHGSWLLLGVLLVVILVQADTAKAQDDVEQKELNALTAFYNATNGAKWTNNAGWLVGNDPGQWFGVSMKNDRVNFINLADNNLDGTLPPEIGDLERLEWFNFSNNKLRGSIPSEIGSLSLLESIFMDNNQLSGSIPAELGNLANLKYIYLNNNQLSGPLPPEIGQLSSLMELRLMENQLVGSIPAELGGLTSLEQLHLFGNDLSGAVPETICNLQPLRILSFPGNQIEDLPDLRCLQKLEFLDVSLNRLTFEDLEPNMGVAQQFIYGLQTDIGEARMDTVFAGKNHTLSYTVGGAHNQYQWYFNGAPIAGATTDTYTIQRAKFEDTGQYMLIITNPMVPDLTLRTEPVDVLIWIDPNNQPPGFPIITQPPDSAAVSVEETGSERFVVEWTTVDDPDGDMVTYQWQLAFTPDFIAPLRNVETGTEAHTEIAHSALYTLLTDHSVAEGSTVQLYHRVLATDGQSNVSWGSYVLYITLGSTSVATEDTVAMPQAFRLRGNYPNPFNPSTQILFDLPAPAAVSIAVIDVRGRTVMQLPARHLPAGYARSVGIEAGDLVSGVYLYRVTARTHDADHVQTGVFVLIR